MRKTNSVLAVVGSVTATYDDVKPLIEKYIIQLQPRLIISGGAEGVDSYAVSIAADNGIPWFELKPIIQTFHGKGGFSERNLLIAFNCDYLLRVVSRRSLTYGSGWTRDCAREFGKETFEETVP